MYKRQFNTDKILGQILEGEKKKNYNKDDKDLYIPNAKANGGNYSAIIRFMPPCLDEELPFVKLYSHGWQDVGGWFIHNCPSTLNEPCPVCKENGKNWSKNEELVRPRSRKTSFYTNIMVVKDKQHPELEGKILKFRYGIKIHEKIMAKLYPEDTDLEQPVVVFDYEKGANFKLIIKTVESGGKKFLNYDSSEFATPGPISLNNKPIVAEELEELDKQLFPLQSIVSKDKFKTYEFLANEFIKKTGIVIETDPDSIPEAKALTEVKNETRVENSNVDDDINFDATKIDVDINKTTVETETTADSDYFDDL